MGDWPVYVDKLVDGVYVDSVNGVAGTAWPIGTPGMPVDNLTDALAIAATRMLHNVYLAPNGGSDYVIPSTISNMRFYGTTINDYLDVAVDLNNQLIDACYFQGLTIDSNNAAANSYIIAKECFIYNLGGKENYLFNCAFGEHTVPVSSLYFFAFDCYSGGGLATELDFTNSGASNNYQLLGLKGGFKLKNLSAGGVSVGIYGSGLDLVIDSTCNAASSTINIYGDVKITNNSGGTVVNDYTNNQQDTRFFQETVAATDVDGTTWKNLKDKSTIYSPVKICGFKVTKGGSWAGNPKIRITDGAGTVKIFPFQDEYVMGTDFTDATQMTLNFPLEVSPLKGYKFQFRSSDAGDGAGETLTLNNLDVMELQ